MNEPRKHHYVPVFYQKYFVNENGLIWVYNRNCRTYKELNPKNVCCQNDLYAFKQEGAPRDQRLESQILEQVDGLGSLAINQLRRTNEVERTAIAYFLGFQYTRLPSAAKLVIELYEKAATGVMRTMAADVERMKVVLENYKRKTGDSIDVTAESMVEAVQGDHIVVSASKTVALKAIVDQAKNVAEVIEQMNWEIIEATPESGFILCDNPVVIVPPRGVNQVGFGVPGAVIYFPLTRRLCLRICGKGTSLASRMIDRNTVRIVNRNTAAHSERFIMGPLKGQIEKIVGETGTADPDPKPRFVIETISTHDGGSVQLTVQPGEHFYLDTGDIA